MLPSIPNGRVKNKTKTDSSYSKQGYGWEYGFLWAKGMDATYKQISEETWTIAAAHLEKIPHVKSHYTRSRKKWFTNSTLTVKNCSSCFRSLILTKRRHARKCINEPTKIGFQRSDFRIRKPRKDVCNFCTVSEWKLRHTRTNVQARAAYNLHKLKVASYQREKQKLIQDNVGKFETLIIEFNYSQNFEIPSLACNEQVYLRLLWLLVFSIHFIKTSPNRSRFYHFLETESRKGANSIASLLYDFVSDVIRENTKVM